MSDDNLDVPRPPRFPSVAALLCAACVGAAAWTWMRYSYSWRMAPGEVKHGSYGWYAEMERGAPGGPGVMRCPSPSQLDPDGNGIVTIAEKIVATHQPVQLPARGRIAGITPRYYSAGPDVPDSSRWNCSVVLDVTASRFHPASIAGLVVGAMGVFVFTVSLRHWLGERRAVG